MTGMIRRIAHIVWFCALLAVWPLQAANTASDTAEELRLLREQNALLKNQVQKQGTQLDTLAKKVSKLEAANAAQQEAAGENPPPAASGFNVGNVHISGEAGVAFFHTGTDGFAPHSEFRVDEARIFFEAPIWESVYFFGGLDIAIREDPGLSTKLGELYLDFEDVSRIWGKTGQASLRVGRLECPFGEEYLTRYAMENPLISHSLSDFWGIDPGIELYGKFGKFSYVIAVQNGGVNGVQDFDGDKSVIGRVSFDPNPNLHFSVSAMRTGDLNAEDDYLSAIWFGNGFFRSIGSAATTKFHADAIEGDITARWSSGHIGVFGGYVHYGDNDPTRDNGRDIYYYSVEAMQKLPHKFYIASRFSHILAPEGYPLVGFGNFDDYFFKTHTTSLWRFSIGGGYRFSERLLVKVEYSFENGSEAGGEGRSSNFFGTEAAFKF